LLEAKLCRRLNGQRRNAKPCAANEVGEADGPGLFGANAAAGETQAAE
jgi:hypothetical protein